MLANCARCGNLFDRHHRNVCQSCIDEEDGMLRVVKDYLSENRLATLPEVVRDTDVPLEVILTFIDDKRVLLVDMPNLRFECQGCGKMTQNGRFCKECTDNMVVELANATEAIRKVRATKPNGRYFSR